MAECNSEKTIAPLGIDASYYSNLDLPHFYQMLQSPSYCYKFYWLEAIVKLISEGITETTFDTVINEMICNAWYSVCEFHIHLSGFQLGEVRDGLERAVLRLAELSGLPANASRTQILNAIQSCNSELHDYKSQLTNMVPYRALSGFFTGNKITPNWSSTRSMVAYIEEVNRDTVVLPYTLGYGSKLKKEIYFNPVWSAMIQEHTVAILGWIQQEKVKWLQTNNPEVPGLIFKLAPLDAGMRKLTHVRNLWAGISEIYPVCDVFTDVLLSDGNYDIDHFVPWSFVMNDELWNLMPMDSSLNSSKSNLLPRWEPFFKRFAERQYAMYNLVHENEKIHALFEQCYRDNLHSLWAARELYIPGNAELEFYNILEKNMRPVYDSAKRQGYDLWTF